MVRRTRITQITAPHIENPYRSTILVIGAAAGEQTDMVKRPEARGWPWLRI